MAVTVASFLEAHPEFSGTEETLIQRKLDDAELQVPAGVWGSQADVAIEMTAAHLLALSPFGDNSRLVNKDGTTIYEGRLKAMQRQVAGGPRVL